MDYVYVNNLGQGEGVNSTEVNTVVNAVLTNEGSLASYCI